MNDSPWYFVGADRRAIVNDLLNDFRHIAAEPGVRIRVLTAPTGFGKTRIVQELFAQMSAEQPEPAYWPRRLEEQGDPSWTRTRKRIFPAVVNAAPDAVLPWMWWGCRVPADPTAGTPRRCMRTLSNCSRMATRSCNG
jgi:hypothetical protein